MQPNLSNLINFANQTNDIRLIRQRCTQFLEANPTLTWQTIREVSIILLLRAVNFPLEPVDMPLTAATMATFVQAVAASNPDIEPDDADDLDDDEEEEEEEEEEERPRRRIRHNHSDEEDDSIVVSNSHVEYESDASSESEYEDSSN